MLAANPRLALLPCNSPPGPPLPLPPQPTRTTHKPLPFGRTGRTAPAVGYNNNKGTRPGPAACRARLASGIELSENLAVAVREAQARLLGRAQEGAKAVEAKFFDGLRAQRKLEEEYRFLALQVRLVA